MDTNEPKSADSSACNSLDSATSWDGPADDLATLRAIMVRLRDPQSGCAWDVEQDFASIAPFTIEEAYEVADAIERDDKDDLCDELGDLLLQVIFHAQMADEEGSFDFGDVVAAITTKMIRRHPHVFGTVDRDDAAAVKARWEDIKAQEKAEKRARQIANGAVLDGPARTLDGVPGTLPPMQRAFKLQAKAARVGFDWPDAASIVDKVREETNEVVEELNHPAPDQGRIEDEIGDLLFVVVNLARKANIDPHTALERTNQKFIKRFQTIEDALRDTDTPVGTASLETMEAQWLEAKKR